MDWQQAWWLTAEQQATLQAWDLQQAGLLQATSESQLQPAMKASEPAYELGGQVLLASSAGQVHKKLGELSRRHGQHRASPY